MRIDLIEEPERLGEVLSIACSMGARYFDKHPTIEWSLNEARVKVTGNGLANEICITWRILHEVAIKAAFRAGWKDARARYEPQQV